MRKEIVDIIGDIFKKYSDEINNNHFDRAILDMYIQYGEMGLVELKKMFEGEKSLLQNYNQAIERIIKVLLKNSDLLN